MKLTDYRQQPTRLIQMTRLPQIVPSETCFRCDVCCRFPEPDSFLRPYFTADDIRRAVVEGLDPGHFPVPAGGQINLIPSPNGQGYLCPAFDPGTARCRIYEVRPLDCQIYPFAVMWNEDHSQVVLGWDSKCPFKRQAAGEGSGVRGEELAVRGSLEAYANQVAELLEREDRLTILVDNPRFIGPYQEDVIILRPLLHLTKGLTKDREASGVRREATETDRQALGVRREAKPSHQEDLASGSAQHLLSPESSVLSPGLSSPLTPYPLPLTASLRPLTLEDRRLVERALASSSCTANNALAAYAFAPHLIWRSLFTFWRAEIGRQLCVFAEYSDGLFMVLPPLGAGPFEPSLTEAFALMRRRNRSSAVSRVENVPEELKVTFETLGYRLRPKDPDYLYRAADLAALAGDRYKSHRAACNRLKKTSQVRYEPYREEDRESCLALFRRWAVQKAVSGLDALAQHMLRDAEPAHQEALAHVQALGLIGRVLRVDGAIRAYTFGYERSSAVFCILLEVADRSVPGAAQTLFRECCREAAHQGYEFINTMDAFGLPSLARSKRAYGPVGLVPSYIATDR